MSKQEITDLIHKVNYAMAYMDNAKIILNQILFFIISHPNDQSLGEIIRLYFKNLDLDFLENTTETIVYDFDNGKIH